MPRPVRLSALVIAASAILAFVPAFAENWPQFRGPNQTGETTAHDLPAEFGPDKNVKWKIALPGHSAATPAVWGENVFVVSPDGEELYLYCLDKSAGSERWKKKLGAGNKKLGFNGKNNLATPSPATDGKHVWVLVGSGDLWCFDNAGVEQWHKNLFGELGEYETGFGIGFTPLLYKNTLYIPYLQQKTSLVAAIDAASGKVKWTTPRATSAEEESKDAYSSPCVIEYPDRAEIVICGADLANAYDSETGEEVWRHGDINPTGNRTLRIIVSPTTDGKRVLVSSAKRGPVHAIRVGGKGDLTKSDHHLWTCNEDTPDVPTPALAGDLVYLLRENGVMSVLDAETGKPHYKERVARSTGAFSPSPVVADGKVYLASEGGAVVVLAAGPEFKLLAENELGELIMATPVVVDDCVFIRTEGHLYCFQKKA